jgi:hypothetical protein
MIALIPMGTSQRPINKLFNKLKKNDTYWGLSVPGFLINASLNLGIKHTDEEDQKTLKILKNKIKKFRILFNDSPTIKDNEVLNEFSTNAAKHNLEPYVSVKNKGDIINVLIEQKKDRIKNIVVFVNSKKNDLVLLHLKTDISMEEFEKTKYAFKNQKEIKP